MKTKTTFINSFVLRLSLWVLSISILHPLHAQETNSRAAGRVITDDKETTAGVTVTITHEPTQNKYAVSTGHDGYFHFFNLKPGGPYSIVITSVGYETLKKDSLFFQLTDEAFFSGNNEIHQFHLQKKTVTLSEIVVSAPNTDKNKIGIATTLNSSLLKSMPSISRNFHDYVRLVPQAKVTGDGVMSLAGQNNRNNTFFIDGANNTDIQGLAVNGMNAGQTGSPPVSIEAIEEINILQAPYDVQYGNFTGGSINAITRSGSNENKSSAWYYFRNENMAGRSPQWVEKPNAVGRYHRPRLSDFYNYTLGAWNSGALLKNKLFYFVLVESQSELRPQPFDLNTYRGSSNRQQLEALTDFIKSEYYYDPGSFIEAKDELKAIRLNLKLDWNPSLKNKFTLSYRFNHAERIFPNTPSSATSIRFENNGINIPSRTHAASFEWKRFFKKGINNRLLVTFINQADDRKWLGQPFSSVTIRDGAATFVFGSEGNTGLFDLNANDFTVLDIFRLVLEKHVLTAGVDLNYTSLDNVYIPNYFGGYTFRNLADFMNKLAPTRLNLSFSLPGEKENQRKYQALRNSFFVNDELWTTKNLKINYGIRLDLKSVASKPVADHFFNDTAFAIISRHYNLDGAASGQLMKSFFSISPRIGAEYKLPRQNIQFRAGAGIFSGHINTTWLSDIFNSNTGNIDIVPPQFYPDPYGQPTPQSLNRNPEDFKGPLRIVAKRFRYPSVFRSSFSIEKKNNHNWSFSFEGIFTKNIQEVIFRNVNIMPPAGKSALPDSRSIYSTNSATEKIEFRNDGIRNPYAQIILVTNNKNKKGYAYSGSFIIRKQTKNFSFVSGYTYGRSWVIFEITGAQTPVLSQWRNVETVNGRNFAGVSTSDNDLRHRVTAWFSQKINFSKGKTACIISMFYNGQSGSPYSYVYNNSMINDNGRINENYDLIYIPKAGELADLFFAPVTNNSGQVLFTPEQQKIALNTFIEKDKYLKNNRGRFAERNGARLPFTHTIDIRVQQDFTIKRKKKNIGISVTYDITNFTNMLNRKWGHTWFLPNDSYPLITFAGWAGTAPLVPQYQFIPLDGKAWTLQTSTLPGNSARWLSQLGVKINVNQIPAPCNLSITDCLYKRPIGISFSSKWTESPL